MPRILAIETATQACSAALLLDNGEVLSRLELAPRRHTALILPFIDALLSEAGIALNALDAVAFGVGPGSFMGLRLATSVAQGLAFGADLPVVPISSLRALAQVALLALPQENKVLAGWDARMGEIYWGLYKRESTTGLACAVSFDGRSGSISHADCRSADILTAPEAVCLAVNCKESDLSVSVSVSERSAAPVTRHEPIIAVGNAWSVYQEQLTPTLRAVLVPANTLYYPSAVAVAQLAEQAVQVGHVLAPEAAAPVYLRDRVAERPNF